MGKIGPGENNGDWVMKVNSAQWEIEKGVAPRTTCILDHTQRW